MPKQSSCEKSNYGRPRWLDAKMFPLWTQAGSGGSVFPVRSKGHDVRNHFKHSVELVDGEGDIVDVLATVEDFLLAQATYEAARQRWPKERIRLSQQIRIVEDSSESN